VLGVLKEAAVELKRLSDDKTANNKLCLVLFEEKYEWKKVAEVHVGDIVKIQDG